MEVSDIRRRVRTAIDAAKLRAAERRTRAIEAKRSYETFLEQRAIPAFHQFAAALVGEGYLYKVLTPAGVVRLASERSPDDFLELGLDDTADPPQVVLRTSRARGRRTVEDVVAMLLKEIVPFLER